MSDLVGLPPPPAASAAAGAGGAIASLLQHCLTSAPLKKAAEAGDVARVKLAMMSTAPEAPPARRALQAAIAAGHVDVVQYMLQQGVPAEPSPAPSAAGTLTAEQRAESAPFFVQAALSGSAPSLRALAAHVGSATAPSSSLGLAVRGHAAALERNLGSRSSQASLVTTPLGAAAWAMRLPTLEAALELILDGDAAAAGAGVDDRAELRPLQQPHQQASGEGGGGGGGRRGGAAAGWLQDFAWAQDATPLLLAVHAAGRSGGAEGGDDFARAACAALLQGRADPDARSSNGETALHAAARFGLPRATAALLGAGADALARNAQGDSAETVATRIGHLACAEVLRTATAAAEAAGGAGGREALTTLEEEEASERARLDSRREKQREKKSRQRERQKAQRGGRGDAAARAPSCGGASTDAEADASAAAAAAAVGRLSAEALRERLTAAQRERTRLQRQVRQANRRQEEERIRAEQAEAKLQELREKTAELSQATAGLEAAAASAEASEQAVRLRAHRVSEERASLQAAVDLEIEEHSAEMTRLQTELSTTLLRGSKAGPSSFESERSRRFAAERRCQEIVSALEASTAELAPALEGKEDLPPLFLEGDGFGPEDPPRPNVPSVELYRRLHAQHRQHMQDMRGLVAALSQQIQERDLELQEELDGFLGAGLPRLLAALRREGLVRGGYAAGTDADRAARLKAALLKV